MSSLRRCAAQISHPWRVRYPREIYIACIPDVNYNSIIPRHQTGHETLVYCGMKRFSILQGLPMFRGMAAEDLETSFDSFERKEYKKGDVIYSKGELRTCINILRSGELAADGGGSLPELGGFAYMGVDNNGLQASLNQVKKILDSTLMHNCLEGHKGHQ